MNPHAVSMMLAVAVAWVASDADPRGAADPIARDAHAAAYGAAVETAVLALRERIERTESLDDLLVARELPMWSGVFDPEHDALAPRVYARLLALHGDERVARHVVAQFCERRPAEEPCAEDRMRARSKPTSTTTSSSANRPRS